uniref:Uncharacterized protein n=1 Tax=Myoviridae sp. ctqYq4 TaxID=2826702 RepID=A0A8S5LWE3_9CAUD|nr:MAG TPA: hypothetical protein [Myoviridae sp. ctqYq4]
MCGPVHNRIIQLLIVSRQARLIAQKCAKNLAFALNR